MKKQKLLALFMAIAMLALVVAGCGGSKTESTGTPASKSEEVVKLGFLGALTGSVANYGIPGKKGNGDGHRRT